MKFGAHVSIAGGIHKAPERARGVGCECFQIFTRSPRGGKPSPLDEKIVQQFHDKCSELGFEDYYVHTPYIINLASKDKALRYSSVSMVEEELERSSLLGAKYVMTHLGSATGLKRSHALLNVVDSLSKILDGKDYSALLLLENSAGQGNTIGGRFEELAEILERVGSPELGVCLDTAHLFGFGYDVRNREGLEDTLSQFSATISADRLRLFHGNDTNVGLGERKDRHEHIGEGKIGINGFKTIVNHPKLKDLNMIVETPPEKVEDDIRHLTELRQNQNKQC